MLLELARWFPRVVGSPGLLLGLARFHFVMGRRLYFALWAGEGMRQPVLSIELRQVAARAWGDVPVLDASRLECVEQELSSSRRVIWKPFAAK